MLQTLLKLLMEIFSPQFEDVLREVEASRKRETTRRIEKAKEEAQASGDTRELQKNLGELTE